MKQNLREVMEGEPCPAGKKYYGRTVQPGSPCCMRCSSFLDREYLDAGRWGVYKIKCAYGGKDVRRN